LAGADPVPAAWSALLLAVAPARVAPAVAFAPAPLNLLAVVAGAAVLVAGIAGQVTHTRLFFAAALVVLPFAADGLWPEQVLAPGEGVVR
jgi:hypothetical protein